MARGSDSIAPFLLPLPQLQSKPQMQLGWSSSPGAGEPSPEQLRSPCSHTFKTQVIYWLRCQSSRHFLSLDSSAENES